MKEIIRSIKDKFSFLFRHIKDFFTIFFHRDYKVILFIIFIIFSLFYNLFSEIFIPEYLTGARILDVKKNGEILIEKANHKYKVYIHGVSLPSFFSKCSGEFKNYFVFNLNNYFNMHQNTTDVKMFKVGLFRIDGYFFIRNRNLNDFIDNGIFLKNKIPPERFTDYCYILEQSGYYNKIPFYKKIYYTIKFYYFKIKNKLIIFYLNLTDSF